MFTSKGLKELKRITDVTYSVGFSPFKWENGGLAQKLVRGTKKHCVLWILHWILHGIFLVNVYVSMLQRIFTGDTRNRTDFAVHANFATGFLLSFSCCAPMLLEEDNYKLLLNTVINFKYIWSEQIHPRKRILLLEMLVQMFIPIVLTNAILCLPLLIQYPTASFRRLRGSDDDPYHFFWVVFTLFDLYNLIQHFTYSILVLTWIVFICPVVNSEILAVLLLNLKSQGARNYSIPKLDKFLRAYRRIQVFNRVFSACSSTFVWPILFLVLVGAHSFCVYVTVKQHSVVNLLGLMFFTFWAINFVPMEMVVYTIGGSIYERSQEALKSFSMIKALRCDAGRRREVRALYPLSVNTANLHKMNKSTFLVTMAVVTNVVMNALLLF